MTYTIYMISGDYAQEWSGEANGIAEAILHACAEWRGLERPRKVLIKKIGGKHASP